MKMKRFNHGGGGRSRPNWILASFLMASLARTMGYALPGVLSALAATSLVAADPPAVAYERDIKPLLSTYCFKCHGMEKHKGDLNLSTIATDEAAHHSVKIWRRVLDRLRPRDMPPDDAPQPTVGEAERLRAGIAILKRPLGPPDPGRVTIRRLNRK